MNGRLANVAVVGVVVAMLGSCGEAPQGVGEPVGGDSKYDEVMALPEGIRVKHTPAEVSPEATGESRYPYRWVYETSVESTVGNLQLIEYGLFSARADHWLRSTLVPEPLTPEEFAGKFSCPDALLKGGQVYTEPENWMRTSGAVEQAYLWYFIGEDVKGSRFRGTGRVDFLDVDVEEE